MKTKQGRSFRLGCTSFVFPDHIIPNVRQIGPYVDEIELLVFESLPASVIPSAAEVTTLGELARDLDLTYNVHLPVDVSLTSASGPARQVAADRIWQVIDRFAPISPVTHTLHLDMDKAGETEIPAWEARARQGLDLLVPHLPLPQTLSLETLWYDPMILAPLAADYPVSICADLGHHFKCGHDPEQTFAQFKDRISIIHFHGVDFSYDPPKDHLGLDRLPGLLFERVTTLLLSFTGTVSIEVFGLAPLRASMEALSAVFENIPDLKHL